MSALEPILQAIHRQGPIPFADFQEAALYGPGGFYAGGGGAGRRRDFLTSPEVGPLFGAVLGRAIDVWWDELGEPDPFVVVDAGAGAGALARAVAQADLQCAAALHYVLVERAGAMRDAHPSHVPLEPPSWALGAGRGPLFASLAEMPAEPIVGVVLANELLDNLPVALVERAADRWQEVRVGEHAGALVEVLVDAAEELSVHVDRLAPAAPVGARVPIQSASADWLRHVLTLVERGRVVVIDYASTSTDLAVRPCSEWLRTYRAHGRGTHPLEVPGEQDVTCEVAVDQLAHVRPPSSDRSQAEFLGDHGIGDLVESARATWKQRAATGDLDAVKARSRVTEAEALTDPAGLGAFRVLEWQVS
jgi:SAM-dependent MidA family methyltransferase